MAKRQQHPKYSEEDQSRLREVVSTIKRKTNLLQADISRICGAGTSFLSQINMNQVRQTKLSVMVVHNLAVLEKALSEERVNRNMAWEEIKAVLIEDLHLPKKKEEKKEKKSKDGSNSTDLVEAIQHMATLQEETNLLLVKLLESQERSNELLQRAVGGPPPVPDKPSPTEEPSPTPPSLKPSNPTTKQISDSILGSEVTPGSTPSEATH